MRSKRFIVAALSAASFLSAGKTFAVDVAAATTQPAPDVAALTRQLGDDDFHVRQAAGDVFRKMGKAAIPALREAKKSADPEIHARADELLQEIEHPIAAVLPVPQPTGFGNQSVRISVMNTAKTIDVQEPGRQTHIEQTADGIMMRVTGQLEGKEVTQDYKAKTADQLKKENPQAFALYQQFSGNDIGIGQMQFQIRANAIAGVNVPPAVIRPANATTDNIDKLEAAVQDQMKAANTPDARQEQVKDLLRQLRDSLPRAAAAGNDLDAQMRDYNRRSDALRKELADLKLPDPGDALPPPAWGRLGISAQEEGVAGEGITITHILPDSRAEKLGLKEQDIIQKVNGQEIHATRDLRKVVTANPKGLIVELLRDGKPMKLEERPAPDAPIPK